jgi:hypothetical protein
MDDNVHSISIQPIRIVLGGVMQLSLDLYMSFFITLPGILLLQFPFVRVWSKTYLGEPNEEFRGI